MAPLWRAGVSVSVLAEFGEDPGLEERLDQRQRAFVLHPGPHRSMTAACGRLSKAASTSASSTHR